jgi:hypothetical protein
VATTLFVHAQKAELSDFQSWDEVDVSARLSRNLDLSWVSQGRLSTGYPNPATYLTGADLKVGLGHYFEMTPSYYYLGVNSVTGHSGHFHVPMLSVTARSAWKGFTVADRNRFLGAIRDGSNFWVYMNGPRVDKPIGDRLWGTSMFVWDEVFYFSLFHEWNRNRFASGLRKQLNDNWAADVYYLRQDDSRIQPRNIDAVGVTVEIRIR